MLVINLLVFISGGIQNHDLSLPPFTIYHQANLISPTIMCIYYNDL